MGRQAGEGRRFESPWLIGPNASPRSAAKTELREVIDCHQFPGPEIPQTGVLSECCAGRDGPALVGKSNDRLGQGGELLLRGPSPLPSGDHRVTT